MRAQRLITLCIIWRNGKTGYSTFMTRRRMILPIPFELGQDDIFSRAIFIEQLKNIDKQFDQLIESGFPEDSRTYMGMTGFRVIINHHGEVIEVEQPGLIADDE